MSENAFKKPLGAFIWIKLSYILALGAAIWTGWLFRAEEQWLIVLLADVAATLVIYLFSVFFKNASFYDPYWSVIPMWIVLYLWWFPEVEVNAPRAWLATALVFTWGARLTWNWWRGWTGLDHEDWRYVDLRKKTGAFFPLVNLTGIQLFPTVLVFLGCLPLFPLLSSSSAAFHWLDVVGGLVALGGILMEGIADQQLRRFRLANTDPQKILDTGLWKFSRHPNYFGELSFWYGLFLMGLGAAPDEWWRGAGALAMTALFLFISIPMIDKRMLARRPHYKDRIRRVSAVIPWPPRKG